MIECTPTWTRCVLAAWLCTSSAHAADAPSGYEVEQSIRALLVSSPYRISDQARGGKIRYTIALATGPAWTFPETSEQHVEKKGDQVELTLCATCGRESASTAETRKRYLEPNAWVQSRDRRIIAFARATPGASVETRMEALVLAIQRHMTGAIDFREYQTATQALASRGGDCTEFAVLLAAAARARGIPARVVAGISYASHFLGEKHAFSPHMWVQVWNGERWASYDAALGHFDAGHIAIAIGDGSPDSLRGTMNVISRMRIVDARGLLPPSAN